MKADDDTQDPAAAAAITLAKASAILGTTTGQAGFELTQKALQESEAVVVFPLLLLELTTIGEGFAAYLATAVQWQVAEARARTSEQAAREFWRAAS